VGWDQRNKASDWRKGDVHGWVAKTFSNKRGRGGTKPNKGEMSLMEISRGSTDLGPQREGEKKYDTVIVVSDQRKTTALGD